MIAGVPYDAEVEYLESTGTQFIDTGVVAESNGWVHAKAECADGYLGNCPLGIDTQNSSYGTAERRLMLVMENNYKGSGTVSSYIDRGNISGSRIVFGAVSPVDTGKQPFRLPLTDTRRHLLFTQWPRSTSGQRFHGKIYFFKLWNGDDNPILDMIPVRVGSTGYMFDRVTRQLFGNSGTGSFVLGSDVARPVLPARVVSVKPYDAEVEYLESTGTQYVDTGFSLTTKSAFEIKTARIGDAWPSVGTGAFSGNRVVITRYSGKETILVDSLNASVGIGQRAGMAYIAKLDIANKTASLDSSNFDISGMSLSNPGGGYHTEGAPMPYDERRIYYAKFWDNGVLVRDFIPVRVGTVGYLYDRANPTGGPLGNGLYPNSGTGSFVLGRDVSVERPLAGLVPVARNVRILPYDAEVDYVESTGRQYVNTGLTIETGFVEFSFEDIGSNTNAAFLGQQSTNPRLLGWISSATAAFIDLGAGATRIDFNAALPDMILPKTVFSANTNSAFFPLYLFTSRNSSGPRSPYGKVRCRYCRFWDAQDNLVRDFIPVRIGSTGYLYDRANPTGGPLGNGLYGSATSTPLIAGPDK